MNPNDQKDTTSDTQVSPWYTNFLLPAGLIFLLLLAGALYFGYQSYSASKVPKLPTESPSNINYPQVSASGVNVGRSEFTVNADWNNQAYKSGDINLCEKITSISLKQTCKDDVISKEAGKKQNIAICDKLSSEIRKISCKNPIYFYEAKNTKNIEICKKIESNPDYQEQCVSAIVIARVQEISTGSLTIDTCNVLVDDSMKMDCIKEVSTKNSIVALGQAQKSSNIKDCDQIINNDIMKEGCRSDIFLKKAIGEQKGELCNEIKDSVKQSRCVIQVENVKDNANYRAARDVGDIQYCNKISNIDTKNKCNDIVYASQAIKNQDISLCEKILNSSEKSKCQSFVNKK